MCQIQPAFFDTWSMTFFALRLFLHDDLTCAFMGNADAVNTEALSENNWEKYQQ